MTSRADRAIDLNADLGEHDGAGYARDEALLSIVSSASIACGAHAGSADVMERTARAAMERGVAVGAHPSYPDREGFGRRDVAIEIGALADSVESQVRALASACRRSGATLRYVKLHGALYNRAARDEAIAIAIARCVRGIDEGLVVLAPPQSEMALAAASAGLSTAAEAFIDRAYLPDGSLAPRHVEGAVLEDALAAASRALRIARDGSVETIDGVTIPLDAESLCVHSDSANALDIVTRTRAALEENGFLIRPFA